MAILIHAGAALFAGCLGRRPEPGRGPETGPGSIGPAARAARRLRLAALGLALCLALFAACMAAGAAGAAGLDALPGNAGNVERNVKAAFLYKFLGYVEFGPGQDASGPLTVGVMGADDIAAELSRLTAGRTIGTRGIAVRTVREGEPLAGLHMLFLDAAAERPAAVLRAAREAGVLGVTEADSGLQQGSVINFRVVAQRVRFEVSLPAAEKSGIRLSSRLLSVAHYVQKGGS